MGAAYTPDEWDSWTARQKAKHRNGNGHGKSLEIEAQRLLPTPEAKLGSSGPDYARANRAGSGGDDLATSVALLPTPSAADAAGGHLTRSGDRADELLLPGVAKSLADGENRLLPTPRAIDATGVRGVTPNRSDEANAKAGATLSDHVADQDWGEYGPAIRRWEAIIGRAAPSPTEIGPKGQPRLSPRFVEWMMGLPAGHVTDPAIWDDGRSDSNARNAQLKALGNGVVPPQCAAATVAFVQDMLAERMGKAASA